MELVGIIVVIILLAIVFSDTPGESAEWDEGPHQAKKK